MTNDNGVKNLISLEEAREIFNREEAAVKAEPVKAEIVPLTAQQRTERCQQAIQVALDEFKCALQPSWLQISPTQQVRSESVQIVALDEKA